VNHGTNVAYVVEGCRCEECRQANRAYERARVRRKAQGRSLFVPAEPVRAHWRRLRELGMNDDEIERAAGVSHHTSHNLFRGHWRTGEPVQRVKRETAEKVFAVRHRKPRLGTRVDATPMREMVLDLMAMGYSVSWVAEQIGVLRSNFAPLKAEHVRVSTLLQVKRLWDSTPEPRTGVTRNERASIARARNEAARWSRSDGAWKRRAS
jgi:hypothetical protein